MSLVVMDHHHDPDAGVYRVVIGWEEMAEQTMLDEDGQPLYAEYEEHETPDGETVRVPVGDPMTEQVSVVTPLGDVVFADADDRWNGKTDEEIVESQLRSIKRAFKKREQEAQEAAEAAERRRVMPGVGQRL